MRPERGADATTVGPGCLERDPDLRWPPVIAPSVLSYMPSPPSNGISLGPLRLHVYGLLIACGIAAAVWLSQRRWEHIGGKPGTMATLALWGVPGGLIGARLYSLITSWQADTQGHRYGPSRSGGGASASGAA